MTPLKTAIITELEFGIIKRKQLLSRLNQQGFAINDRAMRNVIQELVVKDQYPIQSSEKGYCLITNPLQLEDAKRYFDKKAAAEAVRKNCLERNFYLRYANKQLSLI